MTRSLRIALMVMALGAAALAVGPPLVHAVVTSTVFTTATLQDRAHVDNDGIQFKTHAPAARRPARLAAARLMDATGRTVGWVWMRERRDGAVKLVVRARGLTPGFHGFHIHAVGRCEPPSFTTAGGHFNPAGATHGAHAGDLPSLLVNADGTAMLATTTDRFSIGDLRDADGSAVMIHSGADNFANIPPRYGTPDQETLNTGDSGSRVACGVVD